MKAVGWLAAGVLSAGMLAQIAPELPDDLPTTPKPSAPTWALDIAPILYRHCVECHQPGRIAPFSLVTYEDAAKRAAFLAAVTSSGYMPPWLPVPNPHRFTGARHLKQGEIETIHEWAETGAQPGALGEAPEFVPAPQPEWILGEPDVILEMEETFTVEAANRDIYRAFVIPFEVNELAPEVLAAARIDGSEVLGVKAVQVLPQATTAVHHALVYVDASGAARRLDARDEGVGYEAFGEPGFAPSGFLGGYVPGSTPHELPPGVVERLPIDGDIVLLVHYSPVGKPVEDRLRVGIYFTREPVLRINSWLTLGSYAIDIPAGEERHEIVDTLTVPVDVFVLAVSPHMHYLGKEVTTVARTPEGTIEPLVHVRDWNFNWQDKYFYDDPVFLPAGSQVVTRWIFDNSDANLANPHVPPQRVFFGPNSTDEMCELHLDMIPVELEGYEALRELRRQKSIAQFDAMPRHLRTRFDLVEVYQNLGFAAEEARERARNPPAPVSP